MHNSVVYTDLKANLLVTACKTGSFQNKLAEVEMQQSKWEAQTVCVSIIRTLIFTGTLTFLLYF